MISLTDMGDNSCYIEYSNDSISNLQALLDPFISNHGWTLVKSFALTGYTSATAFKSLNKDGVTEKYMIVAYKSSGIHIFPIEHFDSVTETMTNQAYYSTDVNTLQTFTIGSESGRLNVFCTNRWCVLLNTGKSVGTPVANSFTGVLESSVLHDGDDTPSHFLIEGYKASGRANTDGYYVISPVRTFNNVSASASQYSRIGTLICSLGYGCPADYQYLKVPDNLPPFSFPFSHPVYEMYVNLDMYSGHGYTKGKFFGIKMLNTKSLTIGDILTLKCNADFFLDDDLGTDKDFFVLTDSNSSCWCIPI